MHWDAGHWFREYGSAQPGYPPHALAHLNSTMPPTNNPFHLSPTRDRSGASSAPTRRLRTLRPYGCHAGSPLCVPARQGSFPCDNNISPLCGILPTLLRPDAHAFDFAPLRSPTHSTQTRTLEQAFDYADHDRTGHLTRADLEVASVLLLGYTLLPLDLEALIAEEDQSEHVCYRRPIRRHYEIIAKSPKALVVARASGWGAGGAGFRGPPRGIRRCPVAGCTRHRIQRRPETGDRRPEPRPLTFSPRVPLLRSCSFSVRRQRSETETHTVHRGPFFFVGNFLSRLLLRALIWRFAVV